MQQYFVDFNSCEQYVHISGEDYHHIKNVLRMNIDDEIYISNRKIIFLASIKDIKQDVIIAELLHQVQIQRELPIYVSIAQGMPKASKFDTVIQKTTELGVSEIIPVLSERSLIKIDAKTENKKTERFNKIAKSAAEQSHRMIIPEVKSFMTLKELIDYSNFFDYKLVAYEASVDEDKFNFKQTLEKIEQNEKLLILIGPEGGLSETEIKMLKENQFRVISLGLRILRTETAPLFIMSAITYELELKG